MKRKNFVIVSVTLLLALLSLFFVGCSDDKKDSVAAPKNLTIENEILTWDEVSGAITYKVKVDEEVYEVEEARFELPIYDYLDHEYSVCVVTRNGTSPYSKSVVYARTEKPIILPQLHVPYNIRMTANRLMWDTVLNNNGYHVFLDGKLFKTVAKDTYFLDMEFKSDGSYKVVMQTIGDGRTYASSDKSDPYSVTVKNGVGPKQKLPKTEFTFNPATLQLEWKNVYSAAEVSYEIYQDEVSVAKISADATKTKLGYAPVVTGEVSYTMRLVSEDGLYAASDPNEKISFPIADAAPADLAVTAESDPKGFFIKWSERRYADGYVVEIDGVNRPVVTEPYMEIPSSLSSGRHVVRVKTYGHSYYYADSLYSGGIAFYTDAGGRLSLTSETPQHPSADVSEIGIRVLTNAIEGVERYGFCFTGQSGSVTFYSEESLLILTETQLNDRALTEEEAAAAALVFADLESGVKIYVTTHRDGDLYYDSMPSEEIFLCSDKAVTSIAPPRDFRYRSGEFTWEGAEGGDQHYELYLDGEIIEVDALGYSVELTDGVHTAKLRVKGENAMWTELLSLRVPFELDAPSGLSVSKGILSFTGSEDATGYRLFVNGAEVAILRRMEEKVPLSSYIKTDGTYLLRLVAMGDALHTDSPYSEEYLYVKTDADYGTSVKPYVPLSGAELLSVMKKNPSAYIELSTLGNYDFSDYDFTEFEAFAFNGVLWGRGVTLSGITISSPIFTTLSGATIKNLTIEITASDFDFNRKGLLATDAERCRLENCSFILNGEQENASQTDTGLLFYDAKETDLVNVSILCDVTLSSDYGFLFGVVAYSFEGTIHGLTIDGSLTLNGSDVRCGVVSYVGSFSADGIYTYAGAITGSEVTPFSLTIHADDYLAVGGVTLNGVLSSAKNIRTATALTLRAPLLNYYGVAISQAALEDSELGGRVDAEGETLSLYGIGERGMLSLKNVSVGTTLLGKTPEAFGESATITAAGAVDTLSEDCVTEGLAFTGRIECEAPEITVAGCALTAGGAHALASSGTILLKNATQVTVAGGVLYADELTLANASTIELRDVALANVGGAALTAQGLVTLTGSAEIVATRCEDLYYGGAVAMGDMTLSLNGYRVTGSLEATHVLRAAGISYDAESVTLQKADGAAKVADMTVNFRKADAPDLEVAGALIKASAFILPEETLSGRKVELNVTIVSDGSGTVAGFALAAASVDLTDLSLSGALSLSGDGMLCGVAETVGNASALDVSLAYTATDGVNICGAFSNAKSITDLSMRDCEVNYTTVNGTFCGVAASVDNNTTGKVNITNLTFTALPSSAGEGRLSVYGLSESATSVSEFAMTDSSFTVGAFEHLLFCGVARTLSGTSGGRILDSTVACSLNSSATESDVGGLFYEATGRIARTSVGTASRSFAYTSQKRTRFGGLAVNMNDSTLSGGNAYMNLTLDGLPEGSTSLIGGVASVKSTSGNLSASDFKANLTVTKSGAGSALIGGAIADVYGSVAGLKTEVSINANSASDTVGGVVAKANHVTLYNCSSVGTITAQGIVGGIFGDGQNCGLDGAMTTVTITSSSTYVGGLFGRDLSGSTVLISNAASLARLTEKGGGLFGFGQNLSINACYFAGSVPEHTLAVMTENCTANTLFLDAALDGAEGLTAVGEGSLSYQKRSLGYGYTSTELGEKWMADGRRYPYIKAIGYLSAVPSTPNEPTELTVDLSHLSEGFDLYSVLPRFSEGGLTISWVPGEDNITVNGGIVSVSDNGSGTLYGYLAGSDKPLYRVDYTTAEFLPAFSGEGTEESPYLIGDFKYFRYIKTYAETSPTAYFKVAVEESEVRDVTFEDLFTSDQPFRGHLDFSGVTFISPTIGESGILGYVEGGSITDLIFGEGNYSGVLLAVSLKDATVQGVSMTDGVIVGDCVLVREATASAITGTITDAITSEVRSGAICVSITSTASFALIQSMTGGSLTDLSLSFSIDTSGDAEIYVVKSASGAAFTRVQVLYTTEEVDTLLASFVREDSGSTFTGCILIADVAADDDASEIAGFAFSADGSSFVNSIALASATGFCAYPLVKTGTATYSGVKIFGTALGDPVAGVTEMSLDDFRAILVDEVLADESVEKRIPTPLGYDKFKETASVYFYVNPDELELTESEALASLVSISGKKPFSTVVSYAFDGSYAEIVGDRLRITGEGSDGVLTITNLYGESREITVSVPSYVGFAEGEGTEADPYVIASFEDFLKISEFAGEDTVFLLSDNITGTVEESLHLYGRLRGDGTVTVTVTLLCDSLFEEISGRVEGVNFIVNKGSCEMSGGGFFAVKANGMTLKDASVTVNCPSITIEEGTNFGWIFGLAENDCEIENVTFTVTDSTLTMTEAEETESIFGLLKKNSSVGLIAGSGHALHLKNVTLSAQVTLHGIGSVNFGAVGNLIATESTYIVVEELVEKEYCYVDGLILDLTITASSDDLVLGGAAGYSGVSLHDVTGRIDFTVGGTNATVGGIVGEMSAEAELSEADLEGSITATVGSGYFGGGVGNLYGKITDSEFDVAVTATATGELFAGGAVGYGYGSVERIKVCANISATSSLSEESAETLREGGASYQSVVSAGGAAGYLGGSADAVCVEVKSVRAETDYDGTDLYAMAGGLSGYLGEGRNIEIKGVDEGTILASGGRSVAGGVAASVSEEISYAVISGVDLSADWVGGAAGILSSNDEGMMDCVFCAVETDAGQGGLLYLLTEDSEVTNGCRRLGAVAVVTVQGTNGQTDDQKLASAEAFKAAALYAAFNSELWNIDGASIPSLK